MTNTHKYRCIRHTCLPFFSLSYPSLRKKMRERKTERERERMVLGGFGEKTERERGKKEK